MPPETDVDDARNTSTELVPVVGPPGETEWNTLERQAVALAKSGLVPGPYRGRPENLMLCFLTARELRIGPMQALAKIHIIDGKPTMSGELMRALILRAGHKFEIPVHTNERAVVRVARRGGADQEFEWTIEDAKRAELIERARGSKETGTWDKFPKAMLLARATSDAARAVFPDVLAGATYTPEELGAEVDPMTGELTGNRTIERITDAEARAFRDRIEGIVRHGDKFREEIVGQMRERSIVLGKKEGDEYVALLPANRRDELEEIITGIEQWMPKEDAPADDDVAEGEVVGSRAPGVDEADGPTAADEHHDPPRSSDSAPSSGPGTEGPGPTEDEIDDAELVDEVASEGHTLPPSEAQEDGAGAAQGDGLGEVPDTEPTAPVPPPKPRTEAQRRRIMASAGEAGLDTPARHGVIRVVTRNRDESANKISHQEADQVLAVLKSIIAGDLAWDEYDFGGDVGKEHTVVIRNEKGRALLTAIGLM